MVVTFWHASHGSGTPGWTDGRTVARRSTTTATALGAVAATAYATALAVNRSLRRVRGASMEPTLREGDLVAVVPVRAAGVGGPGRGDVVLVRDPRDPSRVTIKRVAGLAGETVRVRRGRLHVDGVPQLERWAAGEGPDAELEVPPGHVVVLGDARHRSSDSRVFGPVPVELLDGRVLARVAPHARLLTGTPRPMTTRPGGADPTPAAGVS